jgi:hypothetical protein
MQNLIALSIVALAVAYLAWRGWKFFSARAKSHSCGSACAGCSTADASATHSVSLVNLQGLPKGGKVPLDSSLDQG